MSKKTKATFTQRRGSRDKGAYNANHNTLEATRKFGVWTKQSIYKRSKKLVIFSKA